MIGLDSPSLALAFSLTDESDIDSLTISSDDIFQRTAALPMLTSASINVIESGSSASEPILTIVNESGEALDTLFIRLDGIPQRTAINGVFRNGRMWVSASQFANALRLPRTEDAEMSLFELCELFGLLLFFDRDVGIIELFSGHERPEQLPAAGERHALIRLEDVTAMGSFSPYYFEFIRMRAMADLLYTHNATFSIAWIPIYVRPMDNYRNDPREYSRHNLEFIFTMDYMIIRGGEMGLHGYTHQRGNENSIVGSEFGSAINDATARSLFHRQIAAAEYLLFTPVSFTFPKYLGTRRQFEIAGEYFDIIWPHPYTRAIRSPYHIRIGQRDVIYFNTPEDHLHGTSEADISSMLRRLNNAGEIANFFFHTHLEYESIHICRDENWFITITYDTSSPLHRILETLRTNGRVLRSPLYFQR